jgi:hypothetical protein
MNAVKATLEVREESVLHGDHHIVQTLLLAAGLTNLIRGMALYQDGTVYKPVPADNPSNVDTKAVLLINVASTDDTPEAPCAVHGAVRGDRVCFADGSACTSALRESLRAWGIYVLGPVAGSAQTPVLVADIADVTAAVDEEIELIFGVKVSDGGDLSYQWYSNTSKSASGGTAVSGATDASYKPSTASAGKYYYYCIAVNTNGGRTAEKVSSAVAVTVGAAQAPVLSAQPEDKSVAVGATAALAVTAAVTDGGTLSYQWYSNTSDSNEGGTAVSGAVSASYSAPTASGGTVYYYCVVTNTLRGLTASTASAAATVTVTA